MNFIESRQYLYGLGHETLAMKLGLESIGILCEELGNPQLNYKVVHIAGTNGKGSTAAMVEAMAACAGYRTGLYTSPHLVDITERIRVAGEDISEEDFAAHATMVREASERLVNSGRLSAPPTFFEQVTALAFCHFAAARVDIVALEVGLGGRLDATNICQPLICAITPVSIDHQEYLGNELRSIAAEKAGILKPGIPVVVAPQDPAAMEVILSRAAEVGAQVIEVASPPNQVDIRDSSDGLFRFRYQTSEAAYAIELNLRGEHQVTNARTAIHIGEELRRLGCCMPKSAIEAGLKRINWAGRLEQLSWKGKTVLLDGAHNLAGAKTLEAFLASFEAGIPITMIFGAMSDKSIAHMADLLFGFADLIIATRINNIRTADPVVIADAATQVNRPALMAEDSATALDLAWEKTPANGLICVCGSLYLIGEVKKILAGNG